MIADNLNAHDQNHYFRTFGICWVTYGIIRLVAALWLISFASTATLMFGPLLNRVPDPFTLMSVFHFIYTLAIVLSLVCGVLGILAGLALLGGQRSARILTLIAAALSLPDIPLGTILGIYSLIILLPMRVVNASNVILHDRPSDIRGHASAA